MLLCMPTPVSTFSTEMFCLTDAASALLMNFITHEAAYCLYPKATLCRSISTLLKPLNFPLRRIVNRFAVWGWTSRRLMLETTQLYGESPIRWALDGDSLRIPLSATPLSFSPPESIGPAAATTWSLATFHGDHHAVHFKVYDDHPSVFPIITATPSIWQLVDDIVSREENLTLLDNEAQTAAGDDS